MISPRKERMPIATDRRSDTEQQKMSMMSKAWLHYYNQTLFEKGLITEQERNRMSHRIDQSHRPPEKKPQAKKKSRNDMEL